MEPTVYGIKALRRPKLMIRAAYLGLAGYRRERDLRRLLGASTPFEGGTALHALEAAEEVFETTRKNGAAHYNVARHLSFLIAIMAERRALGIEPSYAP